MMQMYIHYCVQACRGGRFDYGVEMESTDAPGEEPVPEEEVKEMMETQVSLYLVTVAK